MFIICNYLDICNKHNLPDGFIVEECEVYDESLSDYVVVCQSYRTENVLAWAESNMGDKFQMFMKQFNINPSKAMMFVRLEGKIKSYTEDMVMQAGGLEEFKKLYCKPLGNDVQTIDVGDVRAAQDESDDMTVAEQHKNDVAGSQTDEPEIVEDPYACDSLEDPGRLCDQNEDSVVEEDKHMVDTQSQTSEKTRVIKYCNEMCIYNSDGTFKGFTEGQIVNMLGHLKELDKRIAMDTLNPEYILSDDELQEAAPFLDTIAPSVYKAFVTYIVLNASSETDRIRASVMLDNMCSFLNSMN